MVVDPSEIRYAAWSDSNALSRQLPYSGMASAAQKTQISPSIFVQTFPTDRPLRAMEPEPADRLQSILQYTFHDRSLLELALTAPGADERNHDGNRNLARMGGLAMELVLIRELQNSGLTHGKQSPTLH